MPSGDPHCDRFFLVSRSEESRPYRSGHCSFFDFEHYPKFQFNEKKQYSSFIKTLLDNLTRNDDSNLFSLFFDMMRPLTLS